MNEEALISIIVGIDGYGGENSLHCAVNDAVYLAETLKKVWADRKVLIKTLIWPSLNEDKAKVQQETWGIELPKDASGVSRDGILSAVREFSTLARESDTFIFFFSGHGALIDREPVLITAADDKVDKAAKGIINIKIREIQQAASGCASRRKVMILDCCQNESTFVKNKIAAIDGYKNLKELTQGWSIFLSSSPGEKSLEDQYFGGDMRDGYLQQGVFTAILVEGLRGEATGRGGSVNLVDLAYFVGRRVPIEYQERLEAIALTQTKDGDKNQKSTRGVGLESQNPVLLSEAVAMGGPYQVIMSPGYVPTSQSSIRKTPSKNFFKYFLKFLFGKWPVLFPYKLGFRLAGFLYGILMMSSILFHYQGEKSTNLWMFIPGVGVACVILWWLTNSFAAAANEDRWHPGGYIVLFFYFLWHCIVGISCYSLYDIKHSQVPWQIAQFNYLTIDLFLIFGIAVVLGCNNSHTIISLAETIRPDERREIRQAIRAFQQFKFKMFGIDTYNFIPMISVRPDVYLYFWIAIIVIIIIDLCRYIYINPAEQVNFPLLMTRDISAMALITWLVFWYQAAFKIIQREVYKG